MPISLANARCNVLNSMEGPRIFIPDHLRGPLPEIWTNGDGEINAANLTKQLTWQQLEHVEKLWECCRSNKFKQRDLAGGYFGALNRHVIVHFLDPWKEAKGNKRHSDETLSVTTCFLDKVNSVIEHLKELQPPAHRVNPAQSS